MVDVQTVKTNFTEVLGLSPSRGQYYNEHPNIKQLYIVLTSINNLNSLWMFPKLRNKLGLFSIEYVESFHVQI